MRRSGELATPMGIAVAALLGEGGMAAFAARLRDKGFGRHVDSWTAPEPDRPLTPRMLLRVLGWRQTQDLAELAGLAPGEFLPRLARLLPAAVRRTVRPSAEVRTRDSA
jgi:uncharacterized protein YidB (DUF937 family)